jgi:phosphoglycolate phosphatase
LSQILRTEERTFIETPLYYNYLTRGGRLVGKPDACIIDENAAKSRIILGVHKGIVMEPFNYQHIIWDWNGTLLDDAWLCVEIMSGMLAQRDLPPLSMERYEQIFDFPVVDYYHEVGFDFAVEPFVKLSDEFMATYNRRVRECPLRAGARDALMIGQQHGITQSILSAMQQDTLNRLLDHFDLRAFFTSVTGLDNHHAAGKLTLGQEWIAAQTLPRAAILLVGDTVHDIEVAQALGVDCVVIHSGHHSRERLAVAGVPVLDGLAAVYGD